MTDDIKKKQDLLMQPVWTVFDIMDYFTIKVKSRPSAYRIKNMARDNYDGGTTLGKQYVKRDAVMQCFGTTVEKELRNLMILNGKEV